MSIAESDFASLYRKNLPISNKEKDSQNIAKLYFYAINNLKQENQIAIGIRNKGLYFNPKQSTIRLNDFYYELSKEDINEMVAILKESKVQSWQKEYLFGDKQQLNLMGGEGYNRELCIQYKDGSAYYKKCKRVWNNYQKKI